MTGPLARPAAGGFVDLTFGIVGRSKDAAGAWHFHVRAKHAGQIVGLEIVLGAEWNIWRINLGDVGFFQPCKGSVEFRPLARRAICSVFFSVSFI